MAGSVAHVLNVSIRDALELPIMQLSILYNEAERQRALDTVSINMAFNGDKSGQIEKLLGIHGPYTEGHNKDELKRLKDSVRNV